MKKLKFTSMTVLIAAITITGCRKEDEVCLSEKNVPEKVLYSTKEFRKLEEIGYKSKEDLLKNGWKVLAELNKGISDSIKVDSRAAAPDEEQYIPIESWHLKALGYEDGETSLYKKFSVSGISPTNIDFSPFQGPITGRDISKRGPATIFIGTPIVISSGSSSKTEDPGGYKRAYINQYSEPMPVKLKFIKNTGYVTNSTHTSTLSGTVGASASFKFFGIGASINASVTAGSNQSNSEDRSHYNTLEEEISFTIPSRKVVDFIYMEEEIESLVRYELPIRLEGEFLVSYYPKLVNGKYSFTYPATTLYPKLKNEKGQIVTKRYGNATIYASAPRDITPQDLLVANY